MVQKMSSAAICVAPEIKPKNGVSGFLPREGLTTLKGLDAVVILSEFDDLMATRKALAERTGPLVPLITTSDISEFCVRERHLCIDTTAAGGNASLLSSQ